MNSNFAIADSHLAKVRELKNELASTRCRLSEFEMENGVLRAHMDLALVALDDFRNLSAASRMIIVDGWNAILKRRNVGKMSAIEIERRKVELLSQCRTLVTTGVFVWVIFDGACSNTLVEPGFRITWTGGGGLHRADRMILDYLKAASLLGLDLSRMEVLTDDNDLCAEIKRVSRKKTKVNSFMKTDEICDYAKSY